MAEQLPFTQSNLDILKKNFVWVVILALGYCVLHLYMDQHSMQVDMNNMQKDVIIKNTEAFIRNTDAITQNTEAIKTLVITKHKTDPNGDQ